MSTPAATANAPYLLRTPRLLLRGLELADAPRRKEAVDSSGDHLKDFHLSPERPMSLEAHAAHIRHFRAGFDSDQDRSYGVFSPESGKMLGEVCLIKRASLDALEVGYWLRQDAVGQGFATEMASAVVRTAFEFDRVSRLVLRCRPDNARSAAVARRLGFTFEGLLDWQLEPHRPRGELLCFTLLPTEYPQSPASLLPLEAFDILGRPQALRGEPSVSP